MPKKKILIITTIALAITITLGISYAYWSKTKHQETENIVESGCFNIEVQNEKMR